MPRETAIAIVRRLQEAGHQALLAGGCVRDRLLGIEPADYDIATSARPEQVEALFERTAAVGKAFGIVLVHEGSRQFEVATFRQDGPYRDGRHPESVTFTDARRDAERRDFTINAMFEDPISGEVFDYVGGRRDLEARLIRAVGDPRVRFREDRLRMIRAPRFAARFGFDIEAETLAAIREQAASISQVAAERLAAELLKILTEGGARRGFELLDETGLLEHLLPEITAMKGCPQPPNFHPEGDVFVHTMLCLEHLEPGCSPTLALGVLLHDVAKPVCAGEKDGRITFYRHTRVGADMATDICRRLKLSKAVTERVAWLVAQHLRHCAAERMKQSTLKRFLRQEGIEELLELVRIDALGSNGDLSHYEFCRKKLAELPVVEIRPPRLITGHDLKKLGLTPGPLFRTILREVEDAQLEGRIGTREQALDLVRRNYLEAATRSDPQNQ
ncbi:MAG: CCA tRNA nucleotidyltransferase [Deltaproteobacteria bacterium]|nr:MAG: CCA tRNA nucleotidyltransferase [Deltaproteobacteria bacterium]